MLRSLKRLLVIIPCMILGLFLASNVSVSADGVYLVGTNNSAVVGESNTKENTYYFTSSREWIMKVKDYNASSFGGRDTFLYYRVVKPDGKASAWVKETYINNGGKFNVNIDSLSYTETVDLSSRSSVAPAVTYYVDVRYTAGYVFGLFESDQDKDETIKVIYVDAKNYSDFLPTITLTRDGTTNNYKINASIVKDDKAYGLITNVKYFYSTESLNLASEIKVALVFNSSYNLASNKGSFDFTPSSSVELLIENLEETDGYIYALCETGNGYSAVVKYNIETKEESGRTDTTTPVKDDTSSGLFDYNFGELILLVLVIVLVVSCALIITQKIVDYKKRLY